ncbi:MAG: glucosamine-6-phosphate deaminase [Nanoarchaeota archaeon]|nr:glucosamine-6-phosphate deaminase [Nanoarchaeota archaeon]
MEIVKTKNYSELSREAVAMVISQINGEPNSVICLPTGKTPLKMYKLLVKANKCGEVDFSKVIFLNLDEYFPIDSKDKKSFSYYLSKNFFDKINVKKSNVHLLNSNVRDSAKECRDYESLIRKHPIDLAILGVGVNGHIAFNEPGSFVNSKTRFVELTSESKKINRVDKDALTVGIGTIIKSKKIILLASGKKKSEAIRHLVKGKPNKKYPVSFLKGHRDLTVIVDKKAGSLSV